MNQKIIEKEYRFIISRKNLSLIPPKSIAGFMLQSNKTTKIVDILLERKIKTLKSQDTGIRLRKTLIDGKWFSEFTYKRFLGKENGVVKFDEMTSSIDQELFENVSKGDLSELNFPLLKKVKKEGDLFVLLCIKNKRQVYDYANKKTNLELIVEDITFFSRNKRAKDATIEIEIKSPEEDISSSETFVDEIKRIFECMDSNQGKNSRGMTLLGISC